MFNLTLAEKNKKLKSAIVAGNAKEVKRWLKSGAAPGSIVPSGEPLIAFIENYGDRLATRLITAFLEEGVSPDPLTPNAKTTPLIAAINRGHMDVFNRLVMAQPDWSKVDAKGRSAYHTALAAGHFSLCNAIESKGGLTTAPDSDGITPLIEAVRKKAQLDIFKSILERSSLDEINACPQRAGSALYEAIRARADEKFDLLMQTRGIKLNGDLLFCAVENDYMRGIDRLIAANIDITTPNKNQVTPFMFCVRKGYSYGISAIIVAAQERNIKLPYADAMRVLLEKGKLSISGSIITKLQKEELDEKDPQGVTYLMHAVSLGLAPVARRLISAGADPKITGPDGKTAYMMAFDGKNEDLINVLKAYRLPHEPEYVPPPPPPPPPRKDDLQYKRINDYAIEVGSDSSDLTMTFNFWTQQVIHRDKRNSAHFVVQNFDDIPREQALFDARRKLIELNGMPPELNPRDEAQPAKKFQRKQDNSL